MLVAVPETTSSILLPLPHILAKGSFEGLGDDRRLVFFETSREGVVDRQDEDIAADCLWASRKLFLEQGNLDINHFSWLGNPPGSGMRPEYVIGQPAAVKRHGKSIFVAGEIFHPLSPPPSADGDPGDPVTVAGNGFWANNFWHSLTQMNPPMRWFPSVFGKIDPKGVEWQHRSGRRVRFITGPMHWLSVGFAQRAQHPALGPVQMQAIGPFEGQELIAKALGSSRPVQRGTVLAMNLKTFAKAVQTAEAVTAGEGDVSRPQLRGVPALRRESLDGAEDENALYSRTKRRVLSLILQRKLEGSRRAAAEQFKKLGVPEALSKRFAARLDTELGRIFEKGQA